MAGVRLRGRRPRPRWVGVLGVLVGAAAVRLWLLTTTAARLDGDEAITGLMARRILDGHHLAFYAGQQYMGSAEQYLQAAAFAVLPDSAFTLRLPQVALAVLACGLVHLLAVECGLSPRRALLAAAVFAAGPYFAVWQSVKSMGAYHAALVCGLLGLLVAVSLRGDPRGDPRVVPKVVAFGFVCGVAAWSNLQAGYLLLPAGWWLLGSVRGRLPVTLAGGAAGFVVGFSPALGHLIATGELELSGQHPPYGYAFRANHLVSEAIPRFLGVLDRGDALVAWLPPALVTMAVIGVVGAAVAHHRHTMTAILWLRRDGRHPIALLLLAVVVSPLLFINSGSIVDTPRYLFVLYGIVPVLVAALPVPRSWVRTATDATVACSLVVGALLLHTVAGAIDDIDEDSGGHAVAAGQVVRSEELGSVVDALVASGSETAYADYWLAQVVQWEAGDRLVVEPLYTKRFPYATAAAAADPSPALVVPMVEGDAVADALARRGARFERREVAGWVVFTRVEPGQHPGYAFSMAEALAEAP